MKKDLLVTLADGNYVDRAKQLFSSVYWKAGWTGEYMLLAHGLSAEDLEWFQDRGILITRCEPLTENETVGIQSPATILSKVHLFTPRFREWSRIVYLDGDIIVRGSLGYLQTVSGFGIRFYDALPVIEHVAKLEDDRPLFHRLRKDSDLERDSFNTGVMAFDTDIISDDMFDRLMDLVSLYMGFCTFGDESILNLHFSNPLFSGLCRPLPHAFNALTQHEHALKDDGAVILHFNSERFRPWQNHHPLHAEWSENLRWAEEMDLACVQPARYTPGSDVLEVPRGSLRQKLIRQKAYHSLNLRIRYPPVFATLKETQSFLQRLRDPSLFFNERFLRRIIDSKPITCDPGADLDVHMVVCKDDVLSCIWAVKTLFHYGGMRFNLVIHEDGSFTEGDLSLLAEHLQNCEIVRRTDANSRMARVLSDYPFLSKFRAEEAFYCALKLIDPLYYGNADRIIILDSDTLFFRRPDQMIGLLEEGTPFFPNDYQNSYRYPLEVLNDLFDMDIYSRFNAGLLFYPRGAYLRNLGTMESYFAEVEKHMERPLLWINRHEQTLHAILQTRLGAERLGPEYSISNQSITDDTAFHHFVSDRYRTMYYTEGLKRLKSKRFLREFDLQQG